MKAVRMILYFLILVTLFFAPLQRMEIANLEPIQSVWMSLENDNVILKSDTGDEGSGITVENALADMKQKSKGVVYLDTAEYLFVSESALKEIANVRPYMKDSVYLCKWDGKGSVSEATKYADAHRLGVKFKKWNIDSKMPELPVIELEN